MKRIGLLILVMLLLTVVGSMIFGKDISKDMLKVGIPGAMVLPFLPLSVNTFKSTSGSGYRNTQEVLHKINANTTLTDKYLGTIISNEGATAAVTYILPEADYGKTISFIRMADYVLNIDPQDDEYIIDPRSGKILAVGEVLPLNHLYDKVTLRCVKAGYWVAMDYLSPLENREDATVVTAKIDDYQILAADDGTIFTNTAAEKDIELTLPAAVVGMEYEAVLTESGYNIKVTATTDEYIKNPVTGSFQAVTQYIEAARLGAHIKLRCIATGYWYIETIEGQWLPESTYVVSKTADYSLLDSDSGGVFDNTGTSAHVNFTLPAAVAGMEYTFVVAVAKDVKLTPAAGEYLPFPSNGFLQAAAKYIKSSVIGARIKVMCDVAGIWYIADMQGIWIPEDSPTETHATAYSVEETDNGKIFDTTGASGGVTFTLPAAVPGLVYEFRNLAAQITTIDPDGTETIGLPSTGVVGSAGVTIVSTNVIGEWVRLKCLETGAWVCDGYGGTWAAGA